MSVKDFKRTDEGIIFTGKYLEMYIPIMYFEKNVAEVVGDHFKTLGVLNYRTYSDDSGANPSKVHTMNLPMVIYTYPSGGYELKNLDLVGKGEDQYYVAKYYNGDVVCPSEAPASKAAFRSFLEILLAGKLPGTLPYSQIMDIWAKNFVLNGVNFDIPDVLKEIVVSLLYRWKKDPSITFGKAKGKDPKISDYDYVTAGPREITKQTSAYAGLSFENFDEMAVAAVSATKTGKKQGESPMEPVLRY